MPAMAAGRALLLLVALPSTCGLEKACPRVGAAPGAPCAGAEEESLLLQLGAAVEVMTPSRSPLAAPVVVVLTRSRAPPAESRPQPPALLEAHVEVLTPSRAPPTEARPQPPALLAKVSTAREALSFLATRLNSVIFKFPQWPFGPKQVEEKDLYPYKTVGVQYATVKDFFTMDPWWDWITLVVATVILMGIDLLVLRRLPMTAFYHGMIVGFWVLSGFVYALVVLIEHDGPVAMVWLTGYLLEWMLSVDNLFVFHLIFQKFACPVEHMHKALYIGIAGALIFRLIFFLTLSSLIGVCAWLRIVLGLILIYSGIQTARGDEEEDDPSASKPVLCLKACLGGRLMTRYEDGSLIARDKENKGKMCVTLLFLVVCCLEMTDILFAVDSVSAKIGQIPDPYICYSSSVVAMFGLRGLFFIVRDMVEYFELLKYGLCLILVFIGTELVLSKWLHLATSVVLVVIVSVFAISIAGSKVQKSTLCAGTRKQVGGDSTAPASPQ